MHCESSLPNGPSVIMTLQNNIDRFNICLSDIRCQHQTLICECYPVWVSESKRIDFANRRSVLGFGKWIMTGDPILAVFTVLSQRIDPQNRSPDMTGMLCKRRVSIFNTSTIPDTNIEQTVVFVSPPGRGVKNNFLYTVNTRHHIDTHQFTTGSGKGIGIRAGCFPFT